MGTPLTGSHRRVIVASSLGTVFEWYDFFLYGSLAGIISVQFFAGVNEITGFIFALAAFAAGFAVRPFGALVFGRLGDLVGRKRTFLITILIMGISTALVGVLPTQSQVGVAAPIMLVLLRLLQGFAIGGEYGGAAVYVAEHAPEGRRGFYTSWIQTTATIGLMLSLVVILGCRAVLGPEFEEWGWRIPFLLSVVLLGFSVYIRLQLEESPVFKQMQDEGTLAKAPLSEAFGQWKNLKLVLLVLFGASAGQSVIWYCGQFYSLFFLTQVLKVAAEPANLLLAGALLLGTPFFVLFGSLSDRIGRKPIIMAGLALALVGYFPLFKGLTHYANPGIEAASASSPVTVVADPDACNLQFDPVGKTRFTTSCDIVKTVLAKAGVPYTNQAAPPGTLAYVTIGARRIDSFEGDALPAAEFTARSTEFGDAVKAALKDAGYPASSDSERIDYPMVLLMLTLLVILATMVYGPIAAWMVELFPPRIRYTSMSLPYHIGNGWIGGFLPTVSFALVALTGDIYYGLWYPLVVAGVSLVIGVLFLPGQVNHDERAKDQ